MSVSLSESAMRGGKRPGAGRKPNRLKPIRMLALEPRDPRLARLSPEELRTLEVIARKLAAHPQDAPQNQMESNPAIETEVVQAVNFLIYSRSLRWTRTGLRPSFFGNDGTHWFGSQCRSSIQSSLYMASSGHAESQDSSTAHQSISLTCPHCGAKPKRDCFATSGGLTAIHIARIKAAAKLDSKKKSASTR